MKKFSQTQPRLHWIFLWQVLHSWEFPSVNLAKLNFIMLMNFKIISTCPLGKWSVINNDWRYLSLVWSICSSKVNSLSRVTHICVTKLTIIGSDNGLVPTSAGILLIRTLETNFSEILGKIHSFSFKKMHLKMSSANGHLFSLGLNELKCYVRNTQPSHGRLSVVQLSYYSHMIGRVKFRMLKVLLSTLWSLEHIGPETKWPPFCRGHFHMHFLQWKWLNFNYIFAEVCPQGPINNISALVQIMAWHQPSNNWLSEPIMTILPMHICITQPHYVELIVVTWLHQSHYTCHFFLKSQATQLFI